MNLKLISLLTISNTIGITITITAEKQTQTQNRFALDSETQSTTLIDLLSTSTEHSQLLHLIQITRLVPVINSLPKATLFAPTNSALEETLKAQQHTTNTNQQQDNVQLQLRQTLLYHLLNFTLPLNQTIPKHTPEPLDTLLFPKPTHLLNINNDHNDDDHLLLGHQPQKLRIISRDQVSYIGVDARGQGGIALPGSEQIQQATNGILVPIQSILTPPPSLKKLIQSTPALSTYASILPEQLLDQLDLLPHLTIFAPHNPAWDHLSPIELSYLKSNFSTNDSIKLFRQAATDNVLAPEGIGYSHLLRHELQNHEHTSLALLSLDGNHLSVTLNPLSNQLAINGTEMVEQDILASNGQFVNQWRVIKLLFLLKK
jgi:solute carrier family 25 carnitine/acylcarnitine transporter 20/29